MAGGTKRVLIAPSLLSADFARLGKDVKATEAAGADMFHLDVMDGHFVPNISFGPVVVKTVRRLTALPLDTHLMIEKPERYLEAFRDAGTNHLSVHVETCAHLHRTVDAIRELGMKPGVSLNPTTPVSYLEEILPYIDIVLVMSVNPGFGGQKFIPSSLRKIRRIRALIDRHNFKARIEVDGGVDFRNAAAIVRAGADILVAGNAIFGTRNIGKAVKELQRHSSKI